MGSVIRGGMVAIVLVVLAVLASATYLAAIHVLPGSTVASLLVLALGAGGVTSAVHVTGQQIAANSKTGGTPEHPVYMKAAGVIPTATVETRTTEEPAAP